MRFEYRDEDGDGTTVTLSPSDDQETLVRKLKKVLGLAEGAAAARRLDEGRGSPEMVTFPPAPEPPGQPTNGWKALYEPPEVPERLKGEVELIDPEGGA